MNKELMLIQFSKYVTFGTISVIAAIIIALIGLWIYSEWLIYQQKKNQQLDKVRDKMDGIELKRLLKHQHEHSEKGQSSNSDLSLSSIAINEQTITMSQRCPSSLIS